MDQRCTKDSRSSNVQLLLPGTISISTSGYFSPDLHTSVRPYHRLLHLHCRSWTHLLPFIASSKASTHRSTSFFIGVVRNSLSGNVSLTRSTYTVYPTIVSLFFKALHCYHRSSDHSHPVRFQLHRYSVYSK